MRPGGPPTSRLATPAVGSPCSAMHRPSAAIFDRLRVGDRAGSARRTRNDQAAWTAGCDAWSVPQHRPASRRLGAPVNVNAVPPRAAVARRMRRPHQCRSNVSTWPAQLSATMLRRRHAPWDRLRVIAVSVDKPCAPLTSMRGPRHRETIEAMQNDPVSEPAGSLVR